MENTKLINWHPAFAAGLEVELEAYQDSLTFENEYTLNKKSRRLDLLITKLPGSPPIDSPIAASFLHYNLVDYKSPAQSMNVTNFYKVLSYAYSLPDQFHSDNVLTEMTITLACHSFPVKLIRHIRENILHQKESPLEKIIPGLYHINMKGYFPFPFQLVILPQLPPEAYLWLHCLGKQLDANSPLTELGKAYNPHKNEEPYQTIMNAIIRANLIKKEDADIMCEALYELFADELVKYKNDGIRIGEKNGEKRGILIGEKNGETNLSNLILKLISDNRSSEIERVAADPDYRTVLMKQYHVK